MPNYLKVGLFVFSFGLFFVFSAHPAKAFNITCQSSDGIVKGHASGPSEVWVDEPEDFFYEAVTAFPAKVWGQISYGHDSRFDRTAWQPSGSDTVSHTYPNVGTFTLKIDANDDNGNGCQGSGSTTIIVKARANQTNLPFVIKNNCTSSGIQNATVSIGSSSKSTNGSGFTSFVVDQNKTISWNVTASGYGSRSGSVTTTSADPQPAVQVTLTQNASCASGPPPPPPPPAGACTNGPQGYCADYIRQSIPIVGLTMLPNEIKNVYVEMRNTGTADWAKDGKWYVSLRAVSPVDWGTNQVLGTRTIPQNNGGLSQHQYNFNIRAPATPGFYSFQWQMFRDELYWFGGASPDTTIEVLAPPTCSPAPDGATPDGDTVFANSGTRRTYAGGVSANVTSVSFGAWSDFDEGSGPQTDLVWYPGVNDGQGNWHTDVNLASHTGMGRINVHVYINSPGYVGIFCDTANFTRIAEPPPTVSLTATPSSVITGNSTTLNWVVSGGTATSCTASNNVGDGTWNGAKAFAAGSHNQSTAVLIPLGTWTYNIQCNGPGGVSPVASDTVVVTAVPLVNDAQYIPVQIVATNMAPGSTQTVSITMKNIGTSTWTFGSFYRLGSQNPPDNNTWGTTRAFLNSGQSVVPGAQKTFTFNITAPMAIGPYNFQWRMVTDQAAPFGEWFGELTPNVVINVGNIPTCTSATPDGDTVTGVVGTRRTFVNGASADVTAVRFYAWSSASGQDDIIAYPGIFLAGQWYADVNLASHPEMGLIYVHAYLFSAAFPVALGPQPYLYCNDANFTRVSASANLVSSTKIISTVEGTTYNTNTIIHEDDTVTFRITVRNTGTGNAVVNHICDIPSANFQSLRNVSVAGGGSGSFSGSDCSGDPEINISGMTIGANSSRTITFDSTFKSQGSANLELCSNTATINFTDGTGTRNQTVRFGPTLCNKGSNGSPDFHEIAP